MPKPEPKLPEKFAGLSLKKVENPDPIASVIMQGDHGQSTKRPRAGAVKASRDPSKLYTIDSASYRDSSFITLLKSAGKDLLAWLFYKIRDDLGESSKDLIPFWDDFFAEMLDGKYNDEIKDFSTDSLGHMRDKEMTWILKLMRECWNEDKEKGDTCFNTLDEYIDYPSHKSFLNNLKNQAEIITKHVHIASRIYMGSVLDECITRKTPRLDALKFCLLKFLMLDIFENKEDIGSEIEMDDDDDDIIYGLDCLYLESCEGDDILKLVEYLVTGYNHSIMHQDPDRKCLDLTDMKERFNEILYTLDNSLPLCPINKQFKIRFNYYWDDHYGKFSPKNEWVEYQVKADCKTQAIELAKQDHINSEYFTIDARVGLEDHGLQGDVDP